MYPYAIANSAPNAGEVYVKWNKLSDESIVRLKNCVRSIHAKYMELKSLRNPTASTNNVSLGAMQRLLAEGMILRPPAVEYPNIYRRFENNMKRKLGSESSPLLPNKERGRR